MTSVPLILFTETELSTSEKGDGELLSLIRLGESQLPEIPPSAIAGAYRRALTRTGRSAEFSISESGKIALFPVRSAKGLCRWLASYSSFQSLCAALSISAEPIADGNTVFVPSNRPGIVGETVYVEEYSLQATAAEWLNSVSQAISEKLFRVDEGWLRERMAQNIVVLPDSLFNKLVTVSLPFEERIALDSLVKLPLPDGYQGIEQFPSETVFLSSICGEVLVSASETPLFLQIGGAMRTGRGICRAFSPSAQSAGDVAAPPVVNTSEEKTQLETIQ